MNKVQAQRIHARRRAQERYGLDVTREDLNAIVKAIQEGNVFHGVRLTCSRSLFTLKHKGTMVRVIYDRARKNIATFLPFVDS